MSEPLHHTVVTKLTGYNQRALWGFVRDGVIQCERDRFGLPRYSQEVVTQLKRHRAAAKKRRP